MDEKKKFAKNLRRIRKSKGLSQEQLAEKIDRSPETISHLERGVNQPTLQTIISIREALKVPLDELFGISLDERVSDPKRALLLQKLNNVLNGMDNEKIRVLLDNAKALEKMSK